MPFGPGDLPRPGHRCQRPVGVARALAGHRQDDRHVQDAAGPATLLGRGEQSLQEPRRPVVPRGDEGTSQGGMLELAEVRRLVGHGQTAALRPAQRQVRPTLPHPDPGAQRRDGPGVG